MSKKEKEDITLYKATIINEGNETPEEIQIEKSGDWYTLSTTDAIIALFNSLSTEEIGSIAEETPNIAIVGITVEGCPDELVEAIPAEYMKGVKKPFRVDITSFKTSVSVLNTSISECDVNCNALDDGTREVNIKKLILIDNVSKEEYIIAE